MLADACSEIEHRVAAQSLYQALLPYLSHNATITWVIAYGSIARVVGRLAALLERYDEAEQHFEETLASNERQGFHAWTAWTRLNYGDMLLRRDRPGDRDRAIALLQQAHDFAKESGMGKVERDSERLLASLASSSRGWQFVACHEHCATRMSRPRLLDGQSVRRGRGQWYYQTRPLVLRGTASLYALITAGGVE